MAVPLAVAAAIKFAKFKKVVGAVKEGVKNFWPFVIGCCGCVTLPSCLVVLAGLALPFLIVLLIGSNEALASSSCDTSAMVSGPTTAIGDEVMLASSAALKARLPGVVIDAAAGRTFAQGLTIITNDMAVAMPLPGPSGATPSAITPATSHALNPTVIVELGTNAPIAQADMDALVKALNGDSNITHVVLVTAHAPHPWVAANDKLIMDTAVANGWTPADWDAAVRPNPSWLPNGITPVATATSPGATGFADTVMGTASAASGAGTPGPGAISAGGKQAAYARIIIGVAKTMKIPIRGEIVAIAVAFQESGLQNYANSKIPESLTYPHDAVGSDGYSVGLFQQQTGPFGTSWGTVKQVETPAYAAGAFYHALLAVSGWEGMPVTVAAQKVQASAFPSAYAKWETEATSIVNANQDAPAVPTTFAGYGGTGTSCAVGTGDTASILAAANQLDAMNLPYCWGGGHSNPAVPSTAINGKFGAFCPNASVVGLDCSGAVAWVLEHGGVKVAGSPVSGDFMNLFEAVPGDASTPHPTGVYIYAGATHVFMTINGRVFSSDTSSQKTGGPHWRIWAATAEWEAGMVVRHVPGT